VINGLDGVDVGIMAAAGVAVLIGVLYALLRGNRGDPLERLAAWAQGRRLEYVAPPGDAVLATFVGEVDGMRVAVEVTRVARGFGVDLPTRLTTVTVGGGDPAPAGMPVSEPVCALQPAEWVLDRDGLEVGAALPSGDERFDQRWSARGADAEAVSQVLSPAVRARLMESDAEGLIVEVRRGSVTIPMPGVCADARQLDRRLTLAMNLHTALVA